MTVLKKVKLLNIKETKNLDFIGYIFTTLLIFLQGSYAISGNRVILMTLFLLTIVYFAIKRKKIDKFILVVFTFLVIVNIVQTLNFSFFSINTFIGTIVRFLLPYFLVKIIKHDYLKYYINTIFYFTIISLLLYIPSVLFPEFHSILLNLASNSGIDYLQEENNLIIYTVETTSRLGILRNSGLFWEPGAHSGFLIIALLCNVVIDRALWTPKNLVFIFTILTTFSTSGYLALFLVVFFYYLINSNKITAVIIIPFVVFIAWFSYFKFDFLGERISTEIENTEKGNIEYTGRIGSGLKDFEDILDYPLFGRGRNVATRFEGYDEERFIAFHRTNGLTDFIVKYGLLFGLFYFSSIYKSFSFFCTQNNFKKRFAIFMLIIILTIGLSQTFFQGTFFISLIYFHIVAKQKLLYDKKRILLERLKFKSPVELSCQK